MEVFPYFLGLAAVFSIFSFGILYRKVWMWYLGWTVFYLMASYFGFFFVAALFEATNPTQEAYAFVYLAGGLLFWLPLVAWWANQRSSFGIRDGRPKSSAGD